MNNKGFAVTTMVYASTLLLVLAMFTVLGIESAKYSNQRKLIDNINNTLTKCLEEGEC